MFAAGFQNANARKRRTAVYKDAGEADVLLRSIER